MLKTMKKRNKCSPRGEKGAVAKAKPQKLLVVVFFEQGSPNGKGAEEEDGVPKVHSSFGTYKILPGLHEPSSCDSQCLILNNFLMLRWEGTVPIE